MLASRLIRSVTKSVRPAVRNFGWLNAPISADFKYARVDGKLIREDGVVITDTYPTLEWLLDDPVSLHQFEEPPIVVIVEHLENLVPFE